MKNVDLTYTVFKSLTTSKNLLRQYSETPTQYNLFAVEAGCVSWESTVLKDGGADVTDFEASIKPTANAKITLLNQINTDYSGGRPVIRSESRPSSTVTYFSTRGDSSSAVGDGTTFEWDFSNNTNDVSAPSGFKRKQINVTFKDSIYVKEGTLYFHNGVKGSYLDFYILCPNGAYYLNRSGAPAQASGDVIIEHYLNHHPIQGSVPMGDELNTEAATVNAVPAGYIFRLEITVPDTDSTSNGVAELEIYRSRTYLLPGESI